jgi:hypothetical protein
VYEMVSHPEELGTRNEPDDGNPTVDPTSMVA